MKKSKFDTAFKISILVRNISWFETLRYCSRDQLIQDVVQMHVYFIGHKFNQNNEKQAYLTTPEESELYFVDHRTGTKRSHYL